MSHVIDSIVLCLSGMLTCSIENSAWSQKATSVADQIEQTLNPSKQVECLFSCGNEGHKQLRMSIGDCKRP